MEGKRGQAVVAGRALRQALAQALAQAADRHVDDAVQRHRLATTGGVADGVAVEDLLWVVEEQLEQGEVGAGENHFLTVGLRRREVPLPGAGR